MDLLGVMARFLCPVLGRRGRTDQRQCPRESLYRPQRAVHPAPRYPVHSLFRTQSQPRSIQLVPLRREEPLGKHDQSEFMRRRIVVAHALRRTGPGPRSRIAGFFRRFPPRTIARKRRVLHPERARTIPKRQPRTAERPAGAERDHACTTAGRR